MPGSLSYRAAHATTEVGHPPQLLLTPHARPLRSLSTVQIFPRASTLSYMVFTLTTSGTFSKQTLTLVRGLA